MNTFFFPLLLIQVLSEHRYVREGPGPRPAAVPGPPAAPHCLPEGSRDVSDVPGSTAVEAHGRVLPQYPGRGAGEAVHRAVRGGIRGHLVSPGRKGGRS